MTLAIMGGEPLFSNPVSYQWPRPSVESEALVISQLRSGKLSIYDKSGVVGKFEDAYAALHGVKYGLVTSSGTAALHSAYYSLGISPGDEVLCPTYTFFATAVPLFQLGALPVLVDCNKDGSIDLSGAAELVTERTRAVVVTHMWGLPCWMDFIREFCSNYQLALVEDCSHAHGASFDGQLVGTFGDASAWSLQTQKLVAAGEGGVLLTNSRVIYDRSMLLGHFNKRAQQEMDSAGPLYKYSSTGLGLKYRAHPLGIAFALGQLPNLAGWIACKQGFANELVAIARLIPGVEPIGLSDERRTSAYYALVLRLSQEMAPRRDRLVDAIHAEGFIDLDVPKATSPLHTLAAFQEPISPVFRYGSSSLRARSYPVADGLAHSTVKLSVPAADDKAGAHFVAAFRGVVEKLSEHDFAFD